MKSGTPIVLVLENWQGIVLAAAVAHCAISQYWHSLNCAYSMHICGSIPHFI